MKLPFSRSPQAPRVVLASRSAQAVELLAAGGADIVEAITTRGLIQSLGSPAALVVADPADWVEAGGVTRDQAAAALQSAVAQGVPVLTSQELLAQGFSAERIGKSARVALRYYPSAEIALTSYAGGIGKTTLSLATARAFHELTGLPAAVVEIGTGESVLGAKISAEPPTLYEQLTQGTPPVSWHGVDLYPLSQPEAEVLLQSYQPDALLERIGREHTLVVYDASPLNPLWDLTLARLSVLFVTAIPRADTVVQAQRILRDLKAQSDHAGLRALLAVNMVHTPGERMSVPEADGIWVPYDSARAGHYDPSLATPLLAALYPGWGGHR